MTRVTHELLEVKGHGHQDALSGSSSHYLQRSGHIVTAALYGSDYVHRSVKITAKLRSRSVILVILISITDR